MPERPVFFFIVGDSGTGITSAANYLIYRWAEHQQIESNHLVVLPRKAGMETADDVLYNLVIFMRNEIRTRSLELMEATDARTRAIEDTRPAALIPALQGILQMIDRDLRKLEHCVFAAVIEQLKALDLLTKATEIFHLAETIVVLTSNTTHTGEDVLNQLDSDMHRKIKVVKLEPLHGADVRTLVEERWRRYSSDPNPFDLRGVTDAFSDKTRTIKRVLQIVSTMLKLKQAEFAKFKLGPWPANRAQLGFEEDEIAYKLRVIDDLNH